MKKNKLKENHSSRHEWLFNAIVIFVGMIIAIFYLFCSSIKEIFVKKQPIPITGKVVAVIKRNFYVSNHVNNDCGASIAPSVFRIEETFIKVRDSFNENFSYKIKINNDNLLPDNLLPEVGKEYSFLCKPKRIWGKKIYFC